MSDQKKPPADDADERLEQRQRATGKAIGSGLFALIFSFTAVLVWPRLLEPSNPFWFVGLLVIFGASLTLVSIAFKWMKLSSTNEAFSLPQGSIRTLLAIGIMVLFVVFGLAAMSTDGRYTARVVEPQTPETAVVPPGTTVASEIQRYAAQNVLAIPQPVAAPAAGATAPPPTLRLLRVERVEEKKPPDIADMQKQLLTTLITLLTTVIGFYFGSRSAEVARDKGAADPKPGDPKPGDPEPGDPKPGGGHAGGEPGTTGAPPALQAELDAAAAESADVDARLQAVQAKLATAPAGDQVQALRDDAAVLAAEQAAIAADRRTLDSTVAAALAAGGPWDAATPQAAALRTRQQALLTRLLALEAELA